jgi:protein tyrosine/serine phosphatase
VVDEGEIYRSGRLEPDALSRLIRERGIRTIVDLGAWDTDPALEREMQRVADELGVARYYLPMAGDGRANPNGYVAVLRILGDARNHPALVQCAAGSERTGAAIVLYRRVVQGLRIQSVYAESFEHGHVPEDFEWLAYLADWTGPIESAYHDGGWIPGMPPLEAEPGVMADARPLAKQRLPSDD